MLIPIFNVFVSIYQIGRMIYKKLFQYDCKLRQLFKKNVIYISLFIFLNFPIFIEIIITLIYTQQLSKSGFIRWFSYFSSMLTCLIPFIVSVFRILQGLVRIEWVHKYLKTKRMKKHIIKTGDEESKNYTQSLTGEDDFDRLERLSMENFMRDIFVGISYCIQKSEFCEEYKNDDYTHHVITKEDYNEVLYDETIAQSPFLNVQFLEYAPKTFAAIRNQEEINFNDMARSFLPMKNQAGIRKSDGKSGTFFISTDDSQYMVKTLKSEELELIKSKFLSKYLDYLKENKDSLLCPIYGMYKMIMLGGEDEVLIIVMRNLLGNLKDNIICKYDLKGSSFKRREQFEPEKVESKVMKDQNFDEIEKILMLSQKNIDKLRRITTKDSKFLESIELMDYSLFVVKLDLNKEMSKEMFGKYIQERQERDVSNLMGTSNEEITIRESLISILPESNNDEFKHYRRYLFPSLQNSKGYIIAIIDYFQYYNFFKLMETNYKNLLLMNKSNNTISCVRPDVYSERFIKFIEKITEVKSFFNDFSVSSINNDNRFSVSNN